MSTIDQRLISTVMTRSIRQLAPEEPAMDALKAMQTGAVSSVLVTRDAKVVGIITERDVVRAMHVHADVDGLSCGDLMRAPVISVTAGTRCLDAYHLMVSRGIRHLAVTTDQGHVLGIVSEGDLMRNFGHEYYMTFKGVGGVMTTDFCMLGEEATVADALAGMMVMHQSCVVVVSAGRRAAGVLTERDVVRLCTEHSDPGRLTLRETMRSPALTVGAGGRLHEAVKMMEEAHIRRLVVVGEDGLVCGLLTHHEVARGLEGDYVEYLRGVVEMQVQELVRGAQAIDEKLLLANILRSVSGTAVLAADLDFRISYATPAIDAVLGLCDTDVGGADIRETLSGVGWDEAADAFEAVTMTHLPQHHIVPTGRGPADLQLSMLFDARNRPQGYLVLGQKG